MPRLRSQSTSQLSDLTPGQAQYVLQKLVNDRRVSASEVGRYISDMHREIDTLQQRLESLRATAGGTSASQPQQGLRRGPGRPPGSGARKNVTQTGDGTARKRGRRSGALTAEQRASRQLQGRYLGLIRQIPATRRAQYARIAKEKGREAAIREMQNTLSK